MKYRDLLDKCEQMSEEQLNMDVTVHVASSDEFFKADHLELTDDQEDDRLDDGHPILVIFDIELD